MPPRRKIPELQSLPSFLAPMLAKLGKKPFDSDNFSFEIKWDGTRTLAFIEHDRYWLVNRRRIQMTDRYPEFAFLQTLPAGTVLDGEMVVLKDGKSDFHRLQARDQAQTPLKIRVLARSMPATLIAFDLLYDAYQPIMALPLHLRREKLKSLIRRIHSPRLLLSEAVVGNGKDFFQAVCAKGMEGVIAKRLGSPYLPGKRTDAWIKIKRGATEICAVIGFLPAGAKDFKSLILAAPFNGKLQCVGKVGTGFTDKMRARINRMLRSRLRASPVIPCKTRGVWVEPGLCCKVSFMERTEKGEFRAPVFEELYEE
jgi:bifunctional non-homologous end joining protein LigD